MNPCLKTQPEKFFLNSREERKLWTEVFTASIRAGMLSAAAQIHADAAVEMFRARQAPRRYGWA